MSPLNNAQLAALLGGANQQAAAAAVVRWQTAKDLLCSMLTQVSPVEEEKDEEAEEQMREAVKLAVRFADMLLEELAGKRSPMRPV